MTRYIMATATVFYDVNEVLSDLPLVEEETEDVRMSLAIATIEHLIAQDFETAPGTIKYEHLDALPPEWAFLGGADTQ